ncbi:MAG: porin, partial [Planctomycetaceae bacterium]|nr:porin [Planctomycetaceae bacterium]
AYPGNAARLANVANTGAQVNQVYISAGKAVDGTHGLDIGGTFDFTFGTDAGMIQSAGLEKNTGRGSIDNRHSVGEWGSGDYYSAIAQAYVELAYKKWNVKAGKFYAPFGCDGYKSTDRFFYSLAPTWTFVPATGGGAYATYTVNDKLTVFGGWCSPDRFGETKTDNVGLGGFIWQATKRLNVSYTFAAGALHYPDPDSDIFVNTILLKYQISQKLRTSLDWSYTQDKTAGVTNNTGGIVHDLIYQYNKKWAFGLRSGYVRSEDGDVDWYMVSLGANWTPSKWLVVKPELRYDSIDNVGEFGWGSGDIATFPRNPGKDDQLSGGVSAVVKF